MAYERPSDNKIAGDSLDVFVANAMKSLSTQVALRNAEDETRFNRLVLEGNLPLDQQLAYRRDQLSRIEDDPAEKKRIAGEVSDLTDRLEQKKYSDEYTDKLIQYESGATSIDSMISFLNSRLANTTDEGIKEKIRTSLSDMEGKRFELTQNVLKDQTDYAVNDKTAPILDAQIGRVNSARSKAILSGNDSQLAVLDLQLQSLQQARAESDIEASSRDFAVGTMAGYHNATGTLDAYNAKISSADGSTPVKIGGVQYDSPRQFWTYKRDSYIADDSANGFFGRFNDEHKTDLDVKNSSNALTNNDIASAKSDYDMLTSRPELQTYNFKINASRQDALQHGVDLRATSVQTRYANDYDVNRAFNDLDQLRAMGGNVDAAQSNILTFAAKLKDTQVTNILQTAQDLMKADPTMTPQKALEEAVKTGAAVVLSPTQLVTKTEEQIAQDQAAGAAAGTFGNEPRTTVGSEAGKNVAAGTPPAPVPPTVTPQQNDVSKDYALVGKTVYDKSTGEAFTTEQAFFDKSGLNSFQNVKFDTAFTPPTGGASTQLNNEPNPPAAPTPPVANPPAQTSAPIQGAAPTPGPAAAAPPAAPAPLTYKVASGDTLSAIAQKQLGDARRYTEIAKLNNLTDPNKIKPGQELVIPNK